jgi:hypothetical protein
MLSMRAGKSMSWEPYSKGMTHSFVLEFARQEDLDYYLMEDPVHLAFSAAAKPLIEDSVVVGRLYFFPHILETLLVQSLSRGKELTISRYPRQSTLRPFTPRSDEVEDL